MSTRLYLVKLLYQISSNRAFILMLNKLYQTELHLDVKQTLSDKALPEYQPNHIRHNFCPIRPYQAELINANKALLGKASHRHQPSFIKQSFTSILIRLYQAELFPNQSLLGKALIRIYQAELYTNVDQVLLGKTLHRRQSGIFRQSFTDANQATRPYQAKLHTKAHQITKPYQAALF